MPYTNYSTLFSTIYDEPNPIGQIGHGNHYSVLRSVEWLDVERLPLKEPQIHDFAVIWDIDHDTRVIDAIEKIYMAGLLSPVQFIGESKGSLFIVVAAKFYFSDTESMIESYTKAVNLITQTLDDPWDTGLGCFDRAPGSLHQCFNLHIIPDNETKVLNYLKTIDNLWGLGTKDFV